MAEASLSVESAVIRIDGGREMPSTKGMKMRTWI